MSVTGHPEGGSSGGLPAPDDIALEHSTRLQTLLRSRITEAGGVISFAEYMNAALYEPGLGYYMAGATKFGGHGDFTTAPELTALFGQTLAAQLKRIFDTTPECILELGAGTGKLAQHILESLADRSALRYYILEPSAELAKRQRQRLSEVLPDVLYARLQWLDTLPDGFSGVILANEVMDALPVERFRAQAAGVEQMVVDHTLHMTYRPSGASLQKAVAAIEQDLGGALPVGYVSEVCLLLPAWVRALSQSLHQGIILLIDYGYPRHEYYLSERHQGTLACYYRHRMHDNPMLWPGLQDITAHVDFTAVAEAGVDCGLDLLGYATQSAFLVASGLLQIADQACESLERDVDRITFMQGVKRLTMPGEMGERFQVMALGKRYDRPLQGFSAQDLSHRL